MTYEQARGGVPWGRPRTPLTAALTDGSHARGGRASRTLEDAHAAVGTETLTAGRCLWPGGRTPGPVPSLSYGPHNRRPQGHTRAWGAAARAEGRGFVVLPWTRFPSL